MKIFKKIAAAVLSLSMLSSLAVMPASAEESFSFAYLGQDTATQQHWEGKYGTGGYALLGYRYREEMGENSLSELTRPYIAANSYDLIGGDAIKSLTVTNSDGLLGVDGSTGGISIDMPSAKAADGYHVSAIAFNKKDTGDALHDGMCEFDFTLNDSKEKIFTVYGHETGVYASVVYQFCEPDSGKVLYQKTFDQQPAMNGSYASFRVKGNFKLKILTQGRQNTVSAFFFDDVKSNAAKLSASADKAENAIAVKAEEAEAASAYYLVKYDGEASECVAATDGNTKAWLDRDTVGKTSYIYTLYKYGANGFSRSADCKFTTPQTTDVTLELAELESVYTAEDIIPIKVTAKAGSTPLQNTSIKLMLAGEYIDRKFMEPLIAEVVTDNSGTASYDFEVKVAGNFEIYAALEQNYTVGYTASESERVGVTIRLKPYEAEPYILKMSDAIKYDELISVTGEGFAGDLSFKAAPFTGNESTPAEPPEDAIDAELVQVDELNGQFAVIKLPKDTPAGLYSIWVKNDYGWSEPYTLNESRALFISEYEVRYGMSIQVSGRNLDLRQLNFENHSTAVRLNDGNGNAYVQELTKVTPYSLTFKVDERTPLGKYEVEVTNNGGLSWTGLVSTETQREARKQYLTVLPAGNDPIDLGLAWVDGFKWENRFNVLDYGANNSDKNNDFEAITKAIEAARQAGGGVVYFPNGTYYYNQSMPLYADVVLLGQSTDGTVLIYNGEDGKHIAESTDDGQTKGHYGLAYLTIKADGEDSHPTGIWHGNAWSSAHDQEKRTASEIFMKGVNVVCNIYKDNMKQFSTGEIDVVMKERYTVQDCDLQLRGGMPCVYVNQYVNYNNVTLRYGSGYTFSSAMYTFETNMHIEHVTEYPTEVTDEWNTHGFFGRSYIHWENCTINGLGHWGDSECFCSETPNAQFGLGKVLYSEPSKVYTFSEGPYIGDSTISGHPTSQRNSYLAICIMSGRGLGQIRAVTDFDPDGKWFEIEEPWDVLPDSSSIFTLVCSNDRTTVYNAEVHDGGTLCSFYGLGWDCVADSLTGYNVTGLNCHNTNVTSANRLSFGYFLNYRNCEMVGSMPAIFERHAGEMGVYLSNFRNETNGYYSGVAGYGQEMRNVKVTLDPNGVLYAGKAAINYNTTPSVNDNKKGDISNIILENCYTNGGEYGVSVRSGVGNGIIIRNLTAENMSSGQAVSMPEGNTNYIYLDDGGPTEEGTTLEYAETVSSSIGGEETGFEDMAGFEWAADEVEAARKRKITTGTGVGTFSPAKSVTRAEFLGFIVRAANLSTVEYKDAFSDISADKWYADIVQTAYTNALIDSSMITDGKLLPEQAITREEMAAVAARAVMSLERRVNISAPDAGYADTASINPAYTRFVNIAKQYGIMMGDEANNLNPKATANRAEAVASANRLYSKFREVSDGE